MHATEGEPLLIVGASARAAAESARRAGFRPFAIDLFADADLTEVAEVRLSRTFPDDIPSLARTMPAGDWLYVGGLENYPSVVDELAAARRLLGCSGDVLRRVRDPCLFRDALCRHGASMPESIFDSSELRRLVEREQAATSAGNDSRPAGDGATWLVKRRRSSGGLGIATIGWDELTRLSDDAFDGDRYYQRRIDGRSYGAVFLATLWQTFVLGICEQSTSAETGGARPFRYSGSLGPMARAAVVDTRVGDKIAKLGSLATGAFPLLGIFSLDFLLDAEGGIRPLEINPRYTAGVEIIERANTQLPHSASLMAWHVAACRGEPVLETTDGPWSLYPTGSRQHGKRIVYATADIECVPVAATEELLRSRDEALRRDAWPDVADIPRAGSTIRRDEPLATVFAQADDGGELRKLLDLREQRLRGLFTSIP